jgi:hypothetical protein
VPANNDVELDKEKQPINIKNSPKKLLVPGNPMLPIVKQIKKNEYNGITLTRPE